MNDSESKNFFFEKNFLNDPKSQKSPIYKIFWTALTNVLIFSGMIALDNAFQHIIPVCPGKIKKFYKKFKNCQKIHVLVIIEWSGIFLENPALSLFIIYHCVTPCQKSLKSLERFSWKMRNINQLSINQRKQFHRTFDDKVEGPKNGNEKEERKRGNVLKGRKVQREPGESGL